MVTAACVVGALVGGWAVVMLVVLLPLWLYLEKPWRWP